MTPDIFTDSIPPDSAVRDVEDLAYAIRETALRMVHRANSSHIGGAFSAADVIAALYGHVLRHRPAEPDWPDRDRFVLSKGHCCCALYACLALQGYFPVDDLEAYGQYGSLLMTHASHKVPGVEWSTGSLGHGLGLAAGQALAAKRRGTDWRVFVLLSDAELDEGSTWEAILFAAHHRLSNLTAIVDLNGQQALGATHQILDLGDVEAKFRAFGWEAHGINGHDVPAVLDAFSHPAADRPRCWIAHTVKGKGVEFMEDNLEWHYRAPKTEELLDAALRSLKEHYGR